MTILEQAQAASAGYVIDHSTVVAAAQWLGAAVLALGGFLGLIFKWMMGSISQNQASLTAAVASLEKAVGTFDRREADERSHRERVVDTQQRLVSAQDQILSELRTRKVSA